MSNLESEKVVAVSSRGQVTIPKEFREELGIDTPGRVKFVRTTDDVLGESGMQRVDTEDTWARAADIKFRYSPALGDAFALATAVHVDGTLLVGADDDYDDVTDIPVTRVRTAGT